MKASGKLKIKIAGIGDFGISIIQHFGERNLPGVECLDMNTEWTFKTVNKFIKMGVNLTRGLGAGALVEVGRKAAKEDRAAIIEAIKNCDLLIIVAGLGGGTGSGAAPVVADIAKELKIPIIAMVTTPPELEREIRNKNAQYGLEKLKNIVDILFVLSEERLLSNNLDWRDRSFTEFCKEIGGVLQRNILKVIELFNSSESGNKSIQKILKDVEFDKTFYVELIKKV